ncbi:MAG: dihydropteroate synthase [Solirubrobacterales bacterium]|nr:dihydropteroate synthase [Solirubrobacterales bacterium]
MSRSRHRLMGIVNVTPDSFSDGGLFLDADAALAQAIRLAGEGADILDVGGESTRPGAEPVALEEELRRVLPVIAGIASALPAGPQISIDTTKAAVARAALAAGATLVNDVSALRADPEMAATVAASGADCCLMHMRGEPRMMQEDPRYDDVVDEVKAFLQERLELAVGAGIAVERIMLDPGIGFGKTEAHNLELLDRLDELCTLGAPIVIGTSRKAFIGRILARAAGREQPVDAAARLPGTIATNVLAYARGARVFRVHDVAPVRDALAVAAATLGGRWTRSPGRTPTS